MIRQEYMRLSNISTKSFNFPTLHPHLPLYLHPSISIAFRSIFDWVLRYWSWGDSLGRSLTAKNTGSVLDGGAGKARKVISTIGLVSWVLIKWHNTLMPIIDGMVTFPVELLSANWGIYNRIKTIINILQTPRLPPSFRLSSPSPLLRSKRSIGKWGRGVKSITRTLVGFNF